MLKEEKRVFGGHRTPIGQCINTGYPIVIHEYIAVLLELVKFTSMYTSAQSNATGYNIKLGYAILLRLR